MLMVPRPSSRAFFPRAGMPHRPERRRDGPRLTCVGAFRSRISCRVSRQLVPRVMDMRTSIALLPALVVGIVVAAGPAFAQAGWSASTPLIESDASRTAEQAEAVRTLWRAAV